MGNAASRKTIQQNLEMTLRKRKDRGFRSTSDTLKQNVLKRIKNAIKDDFSKNLRTQNTTQQVSSDGSPLETENFEFIDENMRKSRSQVPMSARLTMKELNDETSLAPIPEGETTSNDNTDHRESQ